MFCYRVLTTFITIPSGSARKIDGKARIYKVPKPYVFYIIIQVEEVNRITSCKVHQ